MSDDTLDITLRPDNRGPIGREMWPEESGQRPAAWQLASRLLHPPAELVARLIAPLGRWAVTSYKRPLWRFVPSLPAFVRPMTAPVKGWWPQRSFPVPERLRSYAGARRDSEVGDAAYDANPLTNFFHEYEHSSSVMIGGIWRSQFPPLPRVERAVEMCRRVSRRAPATPPRRKPPEELTAGLKAAAALTGLSAVGVTDYEQKYRFDDYPHKHEEAGHDKVIVCVLEENYDALQTTPSARHDRATMACVVELMKRQRVLAEYLQAEGYRAHVHDYEGGAVNVPYGVMAGLGQLGLNGVLLTPYAGPRVRLGLVTTNAPLILDQPVDYGIPKICDNCRACVRNCPARALSARRQTFRGTEKSKINAQRCAPVLEVAHDCGICLTVCPVQRYGLKAVHEEFERSGTILGRRTDELEGYTWIDGKYYGPGQRPRIDREFFEKADYAAVDPPHADSIDLFKLST
jgi:epoxyqueuosine reductase